MDKNRIWSMDCVEGMREHIPDASIDVVITDPPYGLEFMGKDWDKFGEGKNHQYWDKRSGTDDFKRRMNREHGTDPYTKGPSVYYAPIEYQSWTTAWAEEAYRVLKPGSLMFVFGGTRTYHRMVCGIEDAGFEIRDCLCWIYATGFPKSQDIGKMFDKRAGDNGEGLVPDDRDTTAPATELAKEWDGWKTVSLKPAWEPIVMAQKPREGTYCENIEKHGVGAINVDATRVPYISEDEQWTMKSDQRALKRWRDMEGRSDSLNPDKDFRSNEKGRYPANVMVDGEECEGPLEGVEVEGSGESGATKGHPVVRKTPHLGETYGDYKHKGTRFEAPRESSLGNGILGPYTRFFVVPKETNRPSYLKHPTVKPYNLVKKLVIMATRPGYTVLDPFMGSGTTAIVCRDLSRYYVGFEKSGEYVEMIERRLRGDKGEKKKGRERRLPPEQQTLW